MSNIILAIICLLIVVVHTAIGIKNIRRREKECTETVIASVEKLIPYDYKIFKFYTVICKFNYKEKEYKIRKGLFENVNGELKEIKVHINPNNPEDCYLKKISERCRRQSIA